MPFDEAVQGARRGLSFSPSHGGPAARLYGLLAAGQPRALRSASAAARKPPEPLRKAVADCLSPPAASHIHGSSSSSSGSAFSTAAEASRTLRDYIASPSTIDMAYTVLVDHALAERDRSPAVVPRCVALLKRYLVKYVPRVQTLRQIELFCTNSLTKCEPTLNRRVLSNSSFLSPPSAFNFANPSLVKSLIYVRSLVAKHIPRLSFQPSSQSTKQPLKSGPSSFLNRSFNLQISPENVSNSTDLDMKDRPGSAMVRSPSMDGDNTENGSSNSMYILFDMLKLRWRVDRQEAQSLVKESEDVLKIQELRLNGFNEAGAAALLVGDADQNPNNLQRRYSSIQDFSDINLIQPSPGTDFATSHSHLKAITALKRLRQAPNEVWINVPTSTFQPRARPLFQYRHYSEQQPLKLNPAEICEVIAEVCSESSTQNGSQLSAAPSRLTSHGRQPAADVAFSVLIKLVIDMYMMDPETAAPLTLYMLEGMLSSQRAASKTRAFDLILNLGVHAHLLEPLPTEDSTQESTIEKECRISSAIENFESWILIVLFEILLLLVQTEERQEIVWASALSCLFYFVCDGGRIIRSRLHGLDIRVIKTLVEISREHAWAEVVHCKLICMLINMLYKLPEFEDLPATFLVDQVDLLGGIDYICLEYSRAVSKEERRDLFLILFDYTVHQVNQSCLTNGVSPYTYEDVRPLISLFTVADYGPEAFYLRVKHGVDGLGDALLASISSAFSQSPDYHHLNSLLEKVMGRLKAMTGTFSEIDGEFTHMVELTKTYGSIRSITQSSTGNPETAHRATLAWSTLHSLLHSAASACRHHGYTWLIDLLLSQIHSNNNSNNDDSNNSESTVWSNVRKLQRQIGVMGSEDVARTKIDAPLSMCVLGGLLKSKHNYIRWGFLFVLERFLMRCQLYLSDQLSQRVRDRRRDSLELDKVVVVVDVMSSALSLVVQINETDHINILKMCDILFSQLCLELPATKTLETTTNNSNSNSSSSSNFDLDFNSDSDSKIRSLAALLLRGRAIAPMELVRRVPAALLYWPLIQLAGAVTDDIALGVAVGSTGRGNTPGATSDIRAALLLLLINKCNADPEAFLEVEGNEFFRGLLDDMDSRVAYYSSAFLLKRMMTEEPESYQRMLQSLISKAQQSNNEKLLENSYLQMRGILQLSSDLGAQ